MVSNRNRIAAFCNFLTKINNTDDVLSKVGLSQKNVAYITSCANIENRKEYKQETRWPLKVRFEKYGETISNGEL